MPTDEKFAAALRVVRRLRAEGYEAYFAGGCVRDLLLGRTPSDYDVATNAAPQIVLDLFPRTFAVGAKFGVVLVADVAGETDCAEVPDLKSALPQEEDRGLCDPTLATKTNTSRGWGTQSFLQEPSVPSPETIFSSPQAPQPQESLTSPEELAAQASRSPLTLEKLAPPQELNPQTLQAPLQLAKLASPQVTQVVNPQEPRSPQPLEKLASPQVVSPQPLRAPQPLERLAPPQVVVTEVATFRADGSYSDGRHPDAVRYSQSAEEDVARRDFTINGLLLDPLACTLSEPEKLRAAVLDHVGGLTDLDSGVVRAIGRPEQRFAEDRLRMLRAVRFAARLNFALDPETEAAIRRQAPRIAEVSRERVRDELTKMLTEGRARHAFELLRQTGLLAEVLPEIERMAGVEQPPQFHPEGDVWQHTLVLLGQLEPDCPMTLGWGALLHDVGKPATFRRGPDRIHFNGHAEIGVAIAAEICRRFRFSNEETRQTLELVENHMRFMDVRRMKDSTLKRFFRLEHFEQHLALHRMDCLGSKGGLENWEYARERWLTMPAEELRPKLLVTGRELIAAGYRPGAAFQPMLEAAEEAQLEGRVRTAAEALSLLRELFGPPPTEAKSTLPEGE